jgi:hypothetical protein
MNIFIDTEDMEERYGEELYKEYLEKQNKDLKEKNVELRIQISSRETVANDLQERIDNATERLNTLIEFWKKYNPIDNTMQVEQFKGVINILGGKNE